VSNFSTRRTAGATPQDCFNDDNVVDFMTYLERRAAAASSPDDQGGAVIPLAFGYVLRGRRLLACRPTDPTTPSPAAAGAKAAA
jgi:hypothetical protein